MGEETPQDSTGPGETQEIRAVPDRARIYPGIFRIDEKSLRNYRSDCSYYEIRLVEYRKDLKFYAAYCKVLNRYLTVYEAELCVRYWDKCPYRMIESVVRRTSP